MTASGNPTAPATKRTRPDGWLCLQDRWHWTPAVGTLSAFACEQPAVIFDCRGWVREQAAHLQDTPPADGTVCRSCRKAAARFQPPA